MKDNLSIVILMIMFVTLVVIFPLYNFFERQDDMSYNLALKATTVFVDKVINNGYLDTETYSEFVLDLANTGNLYDIEIEAHRQTITKDPKYLDKEIYVTQYEIDYTDDIFSALAPTNSTGTLVNKEVKNSIYNMNIGDGFYVKLKNANTTMAGALFNSIITASSPERIVINYGGTVKNEAWRLIDGTVEKKDESLVTMKFVANESLSEIAYNTTAAMYVDLTTQKIGYADEHGKIIPSIKDIASYEEEKCDGEFEKIDEYEVLAHSCYFTLKDCEDKDKLKKKCPGAYKNENCYFSIVGGGSTCSECGQATKNVRYMLTCKYCSHVEYYTYSGCINCEAKKVGKTVDDITFIMGYHEIDTCILNNVNDLNRIVKVFKCNKCSAIYKEYMELKDVCSVCKTRIDKDGYIDGKKEHNKILVLK